MINVHQLSNAISEVHADHTSLDDFERWFRRESRNMHTASEEELAAVFAIESVLSEYRFAELDEDSVKSELVSAIFPFVSPVDKPPPARSPVPVETEAVAYRAVFWVGAANNSNVGENVVENPPLASPPQSVGSNSTYGFIPAEA
jgi:hypothetical protein